jgi:hypothetical protein
VALRANRETVTATSGGSVFIPASDGVASATGPGKIVTAAPGV